MIRLPAPGQSKLLASQADVHHGAGERRKNFDETARYVVEGLDGRAPDTGKHADKNDDKQISQTGNAVSGNLVEKI